MITNQQGRKRTLVVSVFFLIWCAVIALFLFKLQVLDYARHTARVKAQSHRILDLIPQRGTIYDRNGEILAISIRARSAFISNKNADQSLPVFERACRLLGLPPASRSPIRARIRRGEKFIWLKRKLTDEQFRLLREMPVGEVERGAIDFIEEYRRVYPQGRTACHVLGGVGIDEQGLNGVERSLDDEIRGAGGKLKVFIDARKKIFQIKSLQSPQPGKDVHLTIDSSLQFFVERELARAVVDRGARRGAVVMLDALDGSVLAMASFPGYRPDDISRTEPEARKNLAISCLFDPGSTFKVVLAAAALERGVCRPQQTFDCANGVIYVHGRAIEDVHPFPSLSFTDILVHSSNIGAIRIGQRLGKERYFQTIENFGFGSRTGIRLPVEESGILRRPEIWSDVSLTYLSFGYEISVTPLQMTQAFAIIASGGIRRIPNLLLERHPLPGERIISERTAAQLSAILTEVVERGTGKNARISGLQIAGKTGTAKKVVAGRYATRYVATFGGFFPVSNPRIVMFVILDEPENQYYGGEVAAPLFRAIAEKSLAYLRLLPPAIGTLEAKL